MRLTAKPARARPPNRAIVVAVEGGRDDVFGEDVVEDVDVATAMSARGCGAKEGGARKLSVFAL